MHEYLQAVFEEDWHQVPRWAMAGWIAFYAMFLIYAFTMHGGFLFIDFVNLIVHEGGHLLFGWFGPTLGIWGGTILQWLVPLLLAGYFFSQRQTTAFAFCVFFFFENWLYTATYMADARAMALCGTTRPLLRLCERWGGAGWWGQLRGWAGRGKALNRRGRGEHPQRPQRKAMHWLLRVLSAISASSAVYFVSYYGTQSAMNTLVSCATLPLRPEIQTNFLPSGLNMGKPSKPSV